MGFKVFDTRKIDEYTKRAKEQCDDKGMPVVDAPHSQALAYRHRKSIHRKADPNEQNFYCTHAFTPCQSKNKVTR